MNLQNFREAKNKTRHEIAAQVGCHVQQIYNFEVKGDTIPYKYLSAYAKALGVPFTNLKTFAAYRVLEKWRLRK